MFTDVSLVTWLATIAGLVAIVALDLTVIARRNQVVTIRSAVYWVLFYVASGVVHRRRCRRHLRRLVGLLHLRGFPGLHRGQARP